MLKNSILCMFALILMMWLAKGDKRILENFKEKQLTDLIELAMHMTKRFISPRTNTLIIVQKCEFKCEQHDRYHAALMHNFIQNLNDTLAIQLFFAHAESRPWDYNLFIVDSWSAFESLRFIIPSTKHERDFYFYILLTWSSDYLLFRNLSKIFKLCLNFNVNNVVVMTKTKLGDFIGFYTYEMFNEEHCGNDITIREVNRFENGQLRYDFLFPEMLTDFYGCALKVSAQVVKPLLNFHGDFRNETHLRDVQRLDGIEGEILKIMADSLNFTVQLMFSEEASSSIDLNFNSTGCFKHLQEENADVAIGGLSSSIENNYVFSSSFPYHSSLYKFVVRNDIFFGPIKQLINPYKNDTWLMLLVGFTCIIILIAILNCLKAKKVQDFIFGSRNNAPIFNLITALLGYGMPTQILPNLNFSRFILMSWMLLTMEIRNGYQGKMFDSLCLAKRVPVPHTINELLNKDYTLINPWYTDFYPVNRTVIHLNTTNILPLIKKSENSLTAAVIMDYLSYYNLQNRESITLSAVDETIYLFQCVMYFVKHSMLRESFDRKLKAFTNAGITSYIAKKHVRSYFYSLNIHRSADVGVITFQNLNGLYYVFTILIYISIVVFVLELLSKKSRNLKAIMDWLN